MDKLIKSAFEGNIVEFKKEFKDMMKDEYRVKREELRQEIGNTLAGTK